MKKIWFGVVGLVVALVQLGSVAVAAPIFWSNEQSTALPLVFNDDAYIAGDTITIDKPVQGDLFVAGGTVDINANVTGDVFAVAGTVNVRGSIGDDLRLAGGQLNLYGNIGDDVFMGGGKLTVSKGAVVRGDLMVGGGEVIVDGKVSGSLQLGGGKAKLNGTVGGKMMARVGEELSFGPNAKVTGNLEYWSPKENLEAKQVAAKVIYHKISATKDWSKTNWLWGLGISTTIWKIVGLLVLGGLLILMWPKWMPKVSRGVKERMWVAVWHGLLVIVLTPIALLVAASTIVGLPVAGLFGLIYIAVMVLSGITGAHFVGWMILGGKHENPAMQFWALALGLVVLAILTRVPAVGWLIQLMVVSLGVGGVVHEGNRLLKGYRRE